LPSTLTRPATSTAHSLRNLVDTSGYLSRAPEAGEYEVLREAVHALAPKERNPCAGNTAPGPRSPAGRSARGPAVIHRPVAANMRHRVDHARPAQAPPLGYATATASAWAVVTLAYRRSAGGHRQAARVLAWLKITGL
jgi:hypothetical protein